MPRTGRPREKHGCLVVGCKRQHYGAGYCRPHYHRWKRTGDAGPARIGAPRGVSGISPGKQCSVSGCDRVSYTRGYCNAHYLRLLSKGAVGPAKVRRKNAQGAGGRWISGGYVYLSDGKRRSSEHRKVMEEMLQRPLRADESVHHKNGVRTDNRPTNLELWVRYQPAGQRVEDLLKWAREIVSRYG